MGDSSGSDRRNDRRAPIELRVEYGRLNAFFADYTRNISRGGTFIRTDRPLDIGTEFLFRLHIPTLDQPLELRGRVQWVVSEKEATDEQPAGMGIGFLYDTDADRERIASLVGDLMSGSLGPALSQRLLRTRVPGPGKNS